CTLSELSDCQLFISRMDGAILKKMTIQPSEKMFSLPLDLTGLPSGMYCLRLVAREGIGSLKMVISQ
ncbi:MAG: hypothetical protein AAB316_09980, partial [Bacteroidota bacterium]